MLDWTDRHCRAFHRLLTRRARLYTEMVTTGALLHGDVPRHLDFDSDEHPVALQLGGSEPADLGACARLARRWGYDEINLNCGCPSERVQRGAFGACLMAEPRLVADGVKAMIDAAGGLPVTVKHRIGIDRGESYAFVRDFVGAVADAGCEVFIVHARNAWLQGLSPKENREVPPLRYAFVHASSATSRGDDRAQRRHRLRRRDRRATARGRRRDARPARVPRAVGDGGAGTRRFFGEAGPAASRAQVEAAMGRLPRDGSTAPARRGRTRCATRSACGTARRARGAGVRSGRITVSSSSRRARGGAGDRGASRPASGRGLNSAGGGRAASRAATPASASAKATACAAPKGSPRTSMPTAAAVIGSITVKTPADAAGTCLQARHPQPHGDHAGGHRVEDEQQPHRRATTAPKSNDSAIQAPSGVTSARPHRLTSALMRLAETLPVSCLPMTT